MGIARRIRKAWVALTRPDEEPVAAPERAPATAPDERADGEAVVRRRELASLKLDLNETRDALAAERRRLAAVERSQAQAVREAVDSRLEELLCGLVAPMSQLRMQEYLLTASRPVAAADVMSVASTLASAIESAGLEPLGQAGAQMPFDPETAQPLSGGEVAVGEMVLVKLCGYRYHGRIVRKAFVERKG